MISRELALFAREQEVNRDSYERTASPFLEVIGGANPGRVCGWDGGLLLKIDLGYRSGMSLDYRQLSSQACPDFLSYSPHNLGTLPQMMAVIAVLTAYLADIESRIPIS